MKISRKMILIFSAMILLTIGINTAYLIQTSLDRTQENAQMRFNNMGTNMVRSIEQYVRIMDLALADVSSDSSFMDAFAAATGDSSSINLVLSAQNMMSQVLYHSPSVENFYRVSVFSRNGFFLSSHFEKNDTLVSMSDEARDIINGIPWLDSVEADAFQRHLIPPHNDAFCIAQDVPVFSAVRATTWHGKQIGFIEVAAVANDLSSLFAGETNDIWVQAVLSDGSCLYKTDAGDTSVYDAKSLPLNTLTSYSDSLGNKRYVLRTESRWLGLNIYITEDPAVMNSALKSMIVSYIEFGVIIAAVVIALVVLVSISLTRSTRRLTEKVRQMPVGKIIAVQDPSKYLTCVTSARDAEIHVLESSFNEMLTALNLSAQNEIALHESILQSRLKALQTQINPHFVYNTLNIISAKSMENGNEEVTDICDQFAQMLRYSTDTRSETATLADELQQVQRYLLLYKARYEDHLTYAIDVSKNMLGLVLPKLTLQPLVENALTHGYDASVEVQHVEIIGSSDSNQFCLTIRDNGVGFSPDKLQELSHEIEMIESNSSSVLSTSEHIGLINTCQRLHYYSKGTISIRLSNENGGVVRVIIPYKNTTRTTD